MPESADVNVPSDLRTYVIQHHGYLTKACREFAELDLPMTREDGEGELVSATDSMDLFRLTVATQIHPDIISWWGTHALSCLSIAREFATRRGKDELEPVVRLIERDVETFDRAQRLYAGMPDDIQATIRRTGARDGRVVLALFSIRIFAALPGTVLYAWQAEWHDALVAFHSVFGGTPPPEAPEVQSLADRLAETEDGVKALRRQLALAAASLDPSLDVDVDRRPD